MKRSFQQNKIFFRINLRQVRAAEWEEGIESGKPSYLFITWKNKLDKRTDQLNDE